MGKKILAVVVGYVVMAGFVFLSFTIAYLAMGTEGAFEPGVYDVSMLWILTSIVLGLIAAVLGGLVCVLVARSQQAAQILAGIVLALGLLLAVVEMTSGAEKPTVRDSEVSSMDAMQSAKQPPWVAFLNPLLGAAGVMIGARLKK
ncbi:MAG TPA: hypothetical protein VLB27_00420 [candidate division Zixibacteria bacterium]|nr:hypothetical protein [candidate division Zixibacteria bacterium]